MRRFEEPPRSDQTYRRRPGVYAILARDSKILITHQWDPEPEFQLPGGGIDPGEGQIPALHREVMEETGWTISTPRRLGFYRKFVFMPEYDLWAEKICHIYLARPVLQKGPPTEAGHTAFWVPPEVALEMLINVGDRSFLANWMAQPGSG